MRRTKRNIARGPKAKRVTLTMRETEPCASAEGHNYRPEPTELHQPSRSHSLLGASEAPRLSPKGASNDSPGRSEHSEREPGEEIASEARPSQPLLAQNAPGAKVNEALLERDRTAFNPLVGFVPSSTQPNPLPASADSVAPRESQSRTAIDRTTRNRQNAQNSTGPRTAGGKAVSSRNAFKHGLSIQRHVILEYEDPADYEQLLDELREIYEPQSRREDLSVEGIAQCRWALRRFDEGESRLMEYHFAHQASTAFDADDRVTYGEALGYSCLQEPGEPPRPEYPSFLLLQRYRAHWDRRHQRALAEFDCAQRARRADAAEERKQAEESRRQELHEFKVALAQTKLAEAQARTAAKQAKSEEAAFFRALEQHLQALPPGLTEAELAAVGFVPQPGLQPQKTGHGAVSADGFVS